MERPEVVLITGGSSGIGKAIGTYLTQQGFRVYGTTRSKARYPDFHSFELLEMDVHDPETVENAVSGLLEREGRIDVLVNNAGVGITGPVEETPVSEVERAFQTNVFGPIRVVQAVLPAMRDQGAGTIVNISSIAGFMGLPYRGAYSASKGALALLSESLRMETRRFGIRVVDLAPGDFATNIAQGRYHAPITEDSPYGREYGHALDTINAHVDTAGDPVEVAKALHRVLLRSNPSVHYAVGSPMQRISLWLKRLLPGKLYERLLLNHYKL